MSDKIYTCDGCEHRCHVITDAIPFMCVVGYETDNGEDISNWEKKEE